MAARLPWQHRRDLLLVEPLILEFLDLEHSFRYRRQYILPCFWSLTDQVALEVHLATLPGAALERPLD